MKGKDRKAKLLALQNAVKGDSSLLWEYKNGILEPITSMCVCSNGVEETDLVRASVRHTNEVEIVTHGVFLERPDYYHAMCITVDA